VDAVDDDTPSPKLDRKVVHDGGRPAKIEIAFAWHPKFLDRTHVQASGSVEIGAAVPALQPDLLDFVLCEQFLRPIVELGGCEGSRCTAGFSAPQLVLRLEDGTFGAKSEGREAAVNRLALQLLC
jgi:hypothetical protein